MQIRPYSAFFVFAENAYNFVIAHRRVDVGIDPYGDFTLSSHYLLPIKNRPHLVARADLLTSSVFCQKTAICR